MAYHHHYVLIVCIDDDDDDDNDDDSKYNVYSAVITAEPLLEHTRFT